MPVKSRTTTASIVVSIRSSDRQLQDLYARRSAIEKVIHSLQDYERFRAKRSFDWRKLKSA